jgi:hypothetical protein
MDDRTATFRKRGCGMLEEELGSFHTWFPYRVTRKEWTNTSCQLNLGTVLGEIGFPIFAVPPKFAPHSKQGSKSSAKLTGYSARPSPTHHTRDVRTPHSLYITAPPLRHDLDRYLNASMLHPTRLNNYTALRQVAAV